MVTKKANGILLGRSLVSVGKKKGGARFVFVPLDQIANGTVYVPFGGVLANPFPGPAKAYAGDLFDYRTDENGENPTLYLLKTYKVAAVVDAEDKAFDSGKTIYIERSRYSHIPFVGDTLCLEPQTIGGASQNFTVVAVEKEELSGQKVWKLTFDGAIYDEDSDINKGSILVEGDGKGSMLIKNINTLTPNDLDFVWDPSADPTDDDDYENARYHIPVVLGGIMYTNRMSPLPKCVLKLNPSKVNGWFVLGGDWGF